MSFHFLSLETSASVLPSLSALVCFSLGKESSALVGVAEEDQRFGLNFDEQLSKGSGTSSMGKIVPEVFRRAGVLQRNRERKEEVKKRRVQKEV